MASSEMAQSVERCCTDPFACWAPLAAGPFQLASVWLFKPLRPLLEAGSSRRFEAVRGSSETNVLDEFLRSCKIFLGQNFRSVIKLCLVAIEVVPENCRFLFLFTVLIRSSCWKFLLKVLIESYCWMSLFQVLVHSSLVHSASDLPTMWASAWVQ